MSPQEAKKQKTLDRVAEENGVAVVVLDERSHEVSASNNNSICRALTASAEFAPKCAKFCGVAFEKTAGGDEFDYECYAGLVCRAVPVADRGKRFVAIIGRTFTTADNYRKATDRAISGDWAEFPPNDFFENVLMAGSSSSIDRSVNELSRFRPIDVENDLAPARVEEPELPSPKRRDAGRPVTIPASKVNTPVRPKPPVSIVHTQRKQHGLSEAASFRSLYSRLGKLQYQEACEAALEFLWSNFGLVSLVWLERKDKRLVPVAARGTLRELPIKIGIQTDNSRLVAASREERPLELRERVVDGSDRAGRLLNVFAVAVGGEILGAVGVEGPIDREIASRVAGFC